MNWVTIVRLCAVKNVKFVKGVYSTGYHQKYVTNRPGLKKVDGFIVVASVRLLLLFSACEQTNKTIVDLLLRFGAQVNHSCIQGGSALHESCRHGQPELCRKLLEAGADLHTENIYGIQPLFIAAQHGHTGIIHLLTKKGQLYKPVHEISLESIRS